MGAPKKHDEPTRRWVADLVRQHGPRPAVTEAQRQGRPISLGLANRCYREFYPGQSADPGARLDAVDPPPTASTSGTAAAPPVTTPPPPIPQTDQELLAAPDGEAVLLLLIKRAARFTAGDDGGLALRALERVQKLTDAYERLRAQKRQEQREPFRIVELRLPRRDPPP